MVRNLWVEAPAFMRGKERFSAPASSNLNMTSFSAGIGKSRAKAHLKINRSPLDFKSSFPLLKQGASTENSLPQPV